MSKKNSIFYCQNCGTSSSKWLGKCPSCNQWNTFVEEKTSKKESKKDLCSLKIIKILASLGYTSLKDVIGKTELLSQAHYGSSDLDNLDLNPILTKIDDGKVYDYHSEKLRNEVPKTLDDLFEKDGKQFIESGQKIELTYNIQNIVYLSF